MMARTGQAARQEAVFAFAPPEAPAQFIFAEPPIVEQILVDVDELGMVRYRERVIGRRPLGEEVPMGGAR